MSQTAKVVTQFCRGAAAPIGSRQLPLRSFACPIAALALGISVQAVWAQQTAPPPVPAAPGASAQLHIGTTSGFDTETRLQNLLADHQFRRVEAQLDQLPAWQAQVYRGILANRSNESKKSIELLEPLIDQVAAGGNDAREKLLRKALAEDYLRLGDWAKAAEAYKALETRLGGKLTKDEQDELELPFKLMPLAAHNPTMTIEPCSPFEMQVSRNPLGLIDIPVFIDAHPRSWLLDPTLPFNLISRSAAKEAGLTLSQGVATVNTLTGHPTQLRATVIPRFTIGGVLTLRNMTAFVYDDSDYFFQRSNYHVEGVLGMEAMLAFDSIKVTDNQTIFVEPASENVSPEKHDPHASVRFYFDGDQMVVALSPSAASSDGLPMPPQPVDAEERLYAIDAGSQQTYVTSRYYDEHSTEFTGQTAVMFTLPGVTAFPPVPAYTAETVPLMAGEAAFDVHYVPVLTQPLGSAARDDVYGMLGIDALDQLRSYKFDYKSMRFSVVPR
jgi:hypothetical protein